MPLGEIVDPRDVVMGPPPRRLGEVVDPADVVMAGPEAPALGEAPAAPPVKKATAWGAAKRAISESIGGTLGQLASVQDWIGREADAEYNRQWAERFREKGEGFGEVEGVGPNLAYVAVAAPLEVAKLAVTTGALSPLKGAALAARAPAWLAKALPWAGAGGALEAAEPGATPGSIAGQAAIAGAIPLTGPLSRPVRGAVMGAVGTGAGLAEGKPLPEALTEGAVLGGASMIPGRERISRAGQAAGMDRMYEQGGEFVKTTLRGEEVIGRVVSRNEKARSAMIEHIDRHGNLQREKVPLMTVEPIPSPHPVAREISAAEVAAREALSPTQRLARGDVVRGQGVMRGRRGRVMGPGIVPDEVLVGYTRAGGLVDLESVPRGTLSLAKSQAPLKEPAQKLRLGPEPQRIERAAEMFPKAEARIAAGAPIPERIGANVPTTRLGGADVNLIRDEKDLRQFMNVLAEDSELIAAERQVPKPWARTLEGARQRYLDARWALGRSVGEPVNEEQMAALRIMTNAAGDHFWNILEHHRRFPSDQTRADAISSLARLEMFMAKAQGASSTGGRILNIHKVAYQSASDQAKAAIHFVKKAGGSRNIDQTLRLLGDMSPEEVMASAKYLLPATRTQKAVELFKMNLLSGLKTHVVNNTSNVGMQALDFGENALAATFGKLHRGDKVYFRELGDRMTASIEAVPKALRAAQLAWKNEAEGFAMGKVEMSHPGAIGGRLGRFIRIPGRALTVEDEVAKTFAYQAELAAQARRRVMANGRVPRSERNALMRALMENPTDEMREAAEASARRLTFTSELGQAGRKIQGVLNDIPALQFFAPFFRTPTNLAKQAIYRSGPFAFLAPSVWRAVRAGGRERDLALARITTGSAIAGTAYLLTHAGVLTGVGPKEPGRRQAKYETWGPYAADIGDRMIHWGRIDPMAMLGMLGADSAEYERDWGRMSTNEKIGRLVSIPIRGLASKTWVKGVADAMLAAFDPERGAENWAESMARAAVPASSLLGQTASFLDPVRREVSNPLQAMRMQIPGLRSGLPPGRTATGRIAKYGDALGPDLLSPGYGTDISKDPVAIEMGELADKGLFSLGKNRDVDGKRATDEEWQFLWGDTNKRAADRLRPLVSSPGWKRLPADIRADEMKSVYDEERRISRQMIRAMRAQRRR